MNGQRTSTILLGMVLGTVLGVVGGLIVPDVMLVLSIVGRLFINALQILLLPLIVATIIVAIGALGHAQKVGRSIVSTLLYFAATTIAAVAIGTILVLILRPGEGASSAGAFIPDMVTRARATTITDVFSAFVPANLIGSIADGQYLGLIVFTIFFGAVLTSLGTKTTVVIDFFRVVREVTVKLIGWVILVAPIGLFSLVGSAVARNSQSLGSLGGNLALLGLTFALALLVQGLVVLPLLLRLLGRRPVLSYAANSTPALLNAVGTASSAATLPVTYTNVVDDNNVDSRAAAMVLPLGTTINFNGQAIYLTIAAIFVAQMFGLALSIPQVLTIALLAVIMSIGSAGVPGTSLFSLAVIFSLMNYPVEAYGAIGVLVLVDWIFDRGRALLNVWSDAVGAAVVGEMFEFKTARMTRTAVEKPRSSDRGKPTRSRREPRKTTSRSSSDTRGRRSDSRSGGRKPVRGRSDQQADKSTADRPQPSRGRSDRRSSGPSDDSRSRGRQSSGRRDSRPERKQREPLKPPPLPSESNKAPDTRRPEKPQPQSTGSVSAAPESIAEERGQLAADLASWRQDEELRQAVEETPPPSESGPKQADKDRSESERAATRPSPKAGPEANREPSPSEPGREKDEAPPDKRDELPKIRRRELPDRQRATADTDADRSGSQATEEKPPAEKVEREAREERPSGDSARPEKPQETTAQARDDKPDTPAPEPKSAPEREETAASKPKAESDEKPEQDKKQDQAVHYGRTRTRRGPRPKDDDSSADSGSAERPERKPVKEFDADKMSFGRGRKKRTR